MTQSQGQPIESNGWPSLSARPAPWNDLFRRTRLERFGNRWILSARTCTILFTDTHGEVRFVSCSYRPAHKLIAPSTQERTERKFMRQAREGGLAAEVLDCIRTYNFPYFMHLIALEGDAS